MLRHLIRLALSASAFYFLIPLIPGAAFHGNFAHALLAGILFAIAGWVVEFFAIAISTILTITTLGMALFLLIPLWLLGFWLIPALALRMVAELMPSVLMFSGWLPAILGGLIMLFIGVITSGDIHVKIRNNNGRPEATA
jgi:uncharacterized membrane protein YvlD (DUF360 family)